MLGPNSKALAAIALLLLAVRGARAGDEFLVLVHKADSRVEPEEKIEYFGRALAAWSPTHGNSLRAHCLFGRGEGRFSQNEFELAMPDLAKAIELDPGNARAFLLRGRIFMRLGQFAKAARDFSESASIKENAEASWLMGEAYEMSGLWEQAAKAYRAAAELSPEDFHPAVGLARLQMAGKNCPRAVEILDDADKAAEGRSPEVLAHRGRCRPKPADAQADLTKALSLYEERLGGLERAKAAPLEIFEANGGLARTYDWRGESFERQYRLPEALADYEEACGLDYQPACLKAASLRRRKPVPDPAFVKPAAPSRKKAAAQPLEEEAPGAGQVKPKPKKRYKKVHSDPGERFYGS